MRTLHIYMIENLLYIPDEKMIGSIKKKKKKVYLLLTQSIIKKKKKTKNYLTSLSFRDRSQDN